MEFKFDTKPTYTIITPVADELNEKMTGSLRDKLQEMSGTAAANYILDLQHCVKADNTSRGELQSLHEWCYEQKSSLVITGIQPRVKEVLLGGNLDEALNIAPSMDEAVDIISMEILERDLMGENGEWNEEEL